MSSINVNGYRMSSSEERQWGMSVKIGLFKWYNLRWHIKKMIIKYFHSFLHEILHSPGLTSEGLTIELLRNEKKDENYMWGADFKN